MTVDHVIGLLVSLVQFAGELIARVGARLWRLTSVASERKAK